MSKKIHLLLLIILLLPACNTLDKKVSVEKKYDIGFERLRDSALLPDWFFTPSPGDTIGSLGMARTMSVGGNPDVHARRYALLGVLDYFGIKPDTGDKNYQDLIKGNVKTAVIAGKTFSIPNLLKSRDYIIARAISGSLDSPHKSANEFSPFECKPNWICSPASGQTGGVLGVSYRAVSPQRQYELAVNNGLLLMKYAYGVDVRGTEEIRRLRSGTGVIRLRKNNMSLKVLGNASNLRVYVKEVRYVGETLYVWLVSPDLPGFESDNSWLQGNISNGTTGVSKRTASNLLSGQIENAVENAIMNMAKSKDVGIEVDELIRKTKHSSLFDQLIKSSVATKVFPSLRGFYLDRKDRVHVWLVPN